MVEGERTGHIPGCYSEVEGTEFVRGDYLRPVLQIGKFQLQFVVEFGTKSKVVGEYHTEKEAKKGETNEGHPTLKLVSCSLMQCLRG